jgi:hypothetical protein
MGMIGAAVIIGSTLYITWRENQIKVAAAPVPPAD